MHEAMKIKMSGRDVANAIRESIDRLERKKQEAESRFEGAAKGGSSEAKSEAYHAFYFHSVRQEKLRVILPYILAGDSYELTMAEMEYFGMFEGIQGRIRRLG